MDYYYDDGQNFYDDFNYVDGNENIVLRLSDTSIKEVFKNCVLPSLEQIYSYFFILILTNVFFRFGCLIGQQLKCLNINIFKNIEHYLSIISGLIILYNIIHKKLIYIIIIIILNYFLIKLINRLFQSNKILMRKQLNLLNLFYCLLFIVILILCELLLNINTKDWHQIRGVNMIIFMKIISLCIDLNNNRNNQQEVKENQRHHDLPNFIKFSGYLLSPGNCLLGPWISYDDYVSGLKSIKISFQTILWILTNLIVSVIFLLLSNCLVTLLISDNSWKWFIAYREALSFRCSHYFISYLSQSTMLISGLINDNNINKDDTKKLPGNDSNDFNLSKKLFGYQITKPWNIEFPRSLVEVVINWNIPMHRWLRTYIFRIIKPYGVFIGLLSTYLISALLHGLNFQLGLVLLSLGFYTYVEYKLRSKLSYVLNSCINSFQCKLNSCCHELRSRNPLCLLINFIFLILTIVHLSYLGMLFDTTTIIQDEGYSFFHALNKWKELNFLSHLLIIFFYLFYLVI